MQTLLKIWLIPPAINIVTILIGVFLLRRFFKAGVVLILLSVTSLYLLSTPAISSRLGHSLEIHRAVKLENLPQNENLYIVVAGASHYVNAEEFGRSSPNAAGLVRLQYAAYLHHRTGLPILLTGGPLDGHTESHAEVLANSLEQVYKIDSLLLETKSKNTLENAVLSAELLAQKDVKTILLVTHSYHMKRSKLLFEYAGFKVIPAPTQLSDIYDLDDWLFWMPNTTSLYHSSRVIYEYIGIVWYRLLLDISPETVRISKVEQSPAN